MAEASRARFRCNHKHFFATLFFSVALFAESLVQGAGGSCRSRAERRLYHTHYRQEPSPALVDKIKDYEIMHKYCMRSGIRTNNFYGNGTSATADPSLPQCRYVVFVGCGGLGNRVHGLISTFLYALLTNRTLIASHDSDARLFCTPFGGSSWTLDGKEDMRVRKGMGGRVTIDKIRKGGRPRYATLYLKYDARRRDLEFFCDESHAILHPIPWLMMLQGRYIGTLLYGMESFRGEMDRLFPSRDVYSQLARYLINPRDQYWDRITHVFNTHLRDADKRVGLQIRTFSEHDSWANARILDCSVNFAHYLPPPRGAGAHNGTGFPQKIAVFVASLHGTHINFLRKSYGDGYASDGSYVTFHSEKNMEHEAWDLSHHASALVDVFLLSFCDQLQTSMTSTFGELASALAGVEPYAMNIVLRTRFDWKTIKRPVCLLSPSIDPCAQAPRGRPCSRRKDDLFGQPKSVQRCVAGAKYSLQLMVDMPRSN